VSTNQYKIDERRKQVASLLAKSMTERQIAAQLNVSQPTINRDVQALKEMSQQFVYDLAKSDLAYYYKQSIDGLDAVKEQAWSIYHSNNENIQIKDRISALRLVKDCNVDKFELLNAGPSVLTMKSMHDRLARIENGGGEVSETSEVAQ
jgi:IS30 family transposase